jgi:hypothetical protein
VPMVPMRRIGRKPIETTRPGIGSRFIGESGGASDSFGYFATILQRDSKSPLNSCAFLRAALPPLEMAEPAMQAEVSPARNHGMRRACCRFPPPRRMVRKSVHAYAPATPSIACVVGGAAMMPSLCILLVAQPCAAQTAPVPGAIRGAVTDSWPQRIGMRFPLIGMSSAGSGCGRAVSPAQSAIG